MQLLAILLGIIHVVGLANAQTYHGPEDRRLNVALTLKTPSTGVSTTSDGRLFLVLPRLDGSTGPPLVEYHRKSKTMTAYPNKDLFSYKPGKDPSKHVVGMNSQRIGPDGNLWIVDKGSPSLGAPVILPGGPKVVVVDTKTNKVSKMYPLGSSSRSNSFVDDIRFNNDTSKAYLTDAGSPGFIVLDLHSGESRRVLDDHLSTKEYMPVSADGEFLILEGSPWYILNDQLEVSPDGKWLYYQPASGGMSKIETQWVDEAFHNSSLNSKSILGQYVHPFAHTPSTGGTAVDADGNLYNSDTDSQRVLKIFPNGTMTTLVQDPRLQWVDAMWIDSQKRLWMPAAQLNRGNVFNKGVSKVQKPAHVFTIDIGSGPSPIDHE